MRVLDAGLIRKHRPRRFPSRVFRETPSTFHRRLEWLHVVSWVKQNGIGGISLMGSHLTAVKPLLNGRLFKSVCSPRGLTLMHHICRVTCLSAHSNLEESKDPPSRYKGSLSHQCSDLLFVHCAAHRFDTFSPQVSFMNILKISWLRSVSRDYSILINFSTLAETSSSKASNYFLF